MESTTNKSTRTDWIIFGISTVICLLLATFASQWFWVALPFVLTFLVRALRVI